MSPESAARAHAESQAPPVVSTAHQRVGWLELFYDLVFVVVIERLTHLLHDDPDGTRIATVIGLTIIVWLAWFNVTALTNVSGPVGAWGRICIFASMAGVGVLALGLDDLVHGHAWMFVIGYSIARTAVWPMWTRGRRAAGLGRLRPFLYGPVLGVLWLLSALLPHSMIAVAFAVLAFAELSLSLIRPEPGHNVMTIKGPHMMERVGLFLMIVLGESVVQIVNALDTERTPMHWVVAALSMGLLCALWWQIYEATMEKMEHAVEARATSVIDFVGGGQLAIVTGLVCVAAGLSGAIHALGHMSSEHAAVNLSHGSFVCLCLGLLLTSFGISALSQRAWVINLGLRTQQAGGTLRGALIALPLVLVWVFGWHWHPAVVVGVFFALMAFGLWRQADGERRLANFLDSGGDPHVFERPARSERQQHGLRKRVATSSAASEEHEPTEPTGVVTDGSPRP